MAALAEVGELNTHLQRDIDPIRALQALELASGAVRAYCGWDLAEETTTLQVTGSGTVVLSLPTMWLNNVTEVRIDGEAIDISDPTVVSVSRKGQLFRPLGWPAFSVIEVDCTHGYNPIPDLIKLVTLELAARTINNPEGLLSASSGSVSRTWASGGGKPRLTALDERLLNRYALF